MACPCSFERYGFARLCIENGRLPDTHTKHRKPATFANFWRLSSAISVMVGLGAVRAAAGDDPALPAWYRTFGGRPGLTTGALFLVSLRLAVLQLLFAGWASPQRRCWGVAPLA